MLAFPRGALECVSHWRPGRQGTSKVLSGQGRHQPPSKHLLSVIYLVHSCSHHQRPCGEALWKCGGGFSPPHAPGTWVGCGHHCSISTHISQPRRDAPRTCYPQLPKTSPLTSQSPSWHQHPTPPHKASPLKTQIYTVSFFRETQSLRPCHDNQVCCTSLTRRLYQCLESVCILKYEGTLSQ